MNKKLSKKMYYILRLYNIQIIKDKYTYYNTKYGLISYRRSNPYDYYETYLSSKAKLTVFEKKSKIYFIPSYDILKKYFPYVISKSRSNRILMKKFLEEDISIISSQKIMMEYLIEQSSLERALKKVKKKEYKNETFPKLSDCMTETIEEKFLNMGETSKNIYKIIQKAITWRKEFEVVQIGEKFQINNQTFDSEKEAEMFAFLEFCENSSCYLK